MTCFRSLARPGTSFYSGAILCIPLVTEILHRACGAHADGGAPVRFSVAWLLASAVVITTMGARIAQLQSGRTSLTRKLQEADELRRISVQVSSADTLHKAAELILDAVRQQYPCASAALLPGDGEWNESILSQGADQLLAGALERSPLSRVGGVCGEQFGVTEGDCIAATRSGRTSLPGCRSIAAIPLTLPDHSRFATLIVGLPGKQEFGADDIAWLTSFARAVALPLERVRSQEQLARLAYVDPMTGLENYRSFRKQLTEECGRADRYGHPLALLILDVDHFKQINDRYGHPAGDDVLRQVAALIQEHVRSIDMPTRYGGEEFAILCPETAIDDAIGLGERLRCAIAGHQFALPAGETIDVTLSAGVAVYANGAQHESDLVAGADAALYEAKREGRNRVSPAGAQPAIAGMQVA